MLSVEEILKTASEAGASDVHMTVGIPPKMRVNGKLLTMDFPRLFPADTLDVMLNIMTEMQRDKFEEHGEYDLAFSIPGGGRCRVNVYRQKSSVALAFRLISPQPPSCWELGIPGRIMELANKTKGLVLAAGPSGSGKTATLAALIDQINSVREAHIITLESPVEYLHQHKSSMVSQREIGTDTFSCPNAIHAALREDIDVILIGELKDPGTITAAVNAAATGHLVLAGIPSSGTMDALEQLLHAFLPHDRQRLLTRLSDVLEAVIYQQLLPAADGKGRVAAFEALFFDKEAKVLLREGKPGQLSSLLIEGHDMSRYSMDQAIKRLYQDKKITKEIAEEYSSDTI